MASRLSQKIKRHYPVQDTYLSLGLQVKRCTAVEGPLLDELVLLANMGLDLDTEPDEALLLAEQLADYQDYFLFYMDAQDQLHCRKIESQFDYEPGGVPVTAEQFIYHLESVDNQLVYRLSPEALRLASWPIFKRDWVAAYNFFSRQPWLGQYHYPPAYLVVLFYLGAPRKNIWPAIGQQALAELLGHRHHSKGVRKALSRLVLRDSWELLEKACHTLYELHPRWPKVLSDAPKIDPLGILEWQMLIEDMPAWASCRPLVQSLLGNPGQVGMIHQLEDCDRMFVELGYSEGDMHTMIGRCQEYADIKRLHDRLAEKILHERIMNMPEGGYLPARDGSEPLLEEDDLIERLKQPSRGGGFPDSGLVGNAWFQPVVGMEQLILIAQKMRNCAAMYACDAEAGDLCFFLYHDDQEPETALLMLQRASKTRQQWVHGEFSASCNNRPSDQAQQRLAEWYQEQGL